MLGLEELASQLEPLWGQLSGVAAGLEAALRATKSGESTKVRGRVWGGCRGVE